MRLIHNGRAVAVCVTGVLTIAGAVSAAIASAPAGVAGRSDHPGLVAGVGVTWDLCGDNIKTQQQGGTGTVQNKACVSTGSVLDGPSMGSMGVVANHTGAGVSNAVGDGNGIAASPMGLGASEINGIGA